MRPDGAFAFALEATTGEVLWKTDSFLAAARSVQQQAMVDKEKTEGNRRGWVFLNKTVMGVFTCEGASWRKEGLDVAALALTSDAVLVAYPGKREDKGTWNSEVLSKRPPLLDYGDWRLSALGREDGIQKWNVSLPGEPLLNGLAVAADGTVVVTLRDGRLVGLVGKNR